ncbi:hypothetical protein B0T19DRAFT_39995 [Cercophora scortea]|uniref:Ubiquitin-like-conjugating enzyme ATG10 n=1 Tax=Cercophora scortea TaxID=314031 RepID=A0AAE0J4M5_9PEZI|nr:hypothetical protein B0T19DRAFT_39995 [Cercophora scortea]
MAKNSTPLHWDFINYPFLTGEEFDEACHQLDRRYCQATLGPVRRQWKLRVCSALNTSFASGSEYSTYIQIVRPLDGELNDGDLSSYLDSFSFDGHKNAGLMDIDADREMIEAEDADESALPRKLSADVGYVTYEIHLHPTYRAPCLWFSLHELPVDEQAFNIDTVFRRLVPDQYKAGLRGAGAIGGISADHHPITGVPSFFIHPCLLGEAMSTFDCSKETYLMVWLGLVGGCVGLWVPKEMALES